MLGDWRGTYILTIPLRIILTFQPSYLHPDEHFQGFELLCGEVLNFNTNSPWEFGDVPSRSILPLVLQYPFIFLNKYWNLPTITLYYLTRLEFCLFSWVVTDYCLYKLMPTKQERLKLIFFTSISYATLCYQSHTFSNSIETCLVLLSLTIIDNYRSVLELNAKDPKRNQRIASNSSNSLYLGVIVGLGMLNRATFALWLVFPSHFVAKYAFNCSFKSVFTTLFSTIVTLLVGFALDLWWFNRKLVVKILIPYIEQSVITKDPKFFLLALKKLYNSVVASPSVIPLINNVVYNLNENNLALHGLHPRYTHVLVNLPLLFGPLLLLVIYPRNYIRTTTYLALASGVLLLSLFPHQELRFLLPLVPLGCCSIDLWSWTEVEVIPREQQEEAETKEELKDDSETEPEAKKEAKKESEIQPRPILKKKSSKIVPWIIRSSVLFNLGMAIVMGVLHQGGVIPALEFIQARNKETRSVAVFWRTYSPPLWILGDKSVSIFSEPDPDLRLMGFINYMADDLPQTANAVVDLMGMDPVIFKSSLDVTIRNVPMLPDTEVLLVAPVASFNSHLQDFANLNFTQIYNYHYHLDFDHFDDYNLHGVTALQPGLGIWKVVPIEKETQL